MLTHNQRFLQARADVEVFLCPSSSSCLCGSAVRGHRMLLPELFSPPSVRVEAVAVPRQVPWVDDLQEGDERRVICGFRQWATFVSIA